MADNPGRSYTYPNESDNPDRIDVLRNRFGLRSHAALRETEYEITRIRLDGMGAGNGPEGSFDANHLKAIHAYLFQPIYEWAGHFRNEQPMVDGAKVSGIGVLSKGETAFLHGSRIDIGLREAFKPIADPEVLRGSSRADFIEKAGAVLAELNFVHPFREGNGRTAEAFIQALGREYGHDVRFAAITKTRMIEASIETTNDPSSRAMVQLMQDAVEPGRREALLVALDHLRSLGEDPSTFNVRTAQRGEEITGSILAIGGPTASIVTGTGIIVADRNDLPRNIGAEEQEITFQAVSEYPEGYSRDTPLTHREQHAQAFLGLPREQAERIPELESSFETLDRLEELAAFEFDRDTPEFREIMETGRTTIAADIVAGRTHSPDLADAIIERSGAEHGLDID